MHIHSLSARVHLPCDDIREVIPHGKNFTVLCMHKFLRYACMRACMHAFMTWRHYPLYRSWLLVAHAILWPRGASYILLAWFSRLIVANFCSHDWLFRKNKCKETKLMSLVYSKALRSLWKSLKQPYGNGLNCAKRSYRCMCVLAPNSCMWMRGLPVANRKMAAHSFTHDECFPRLGNIRKKCISSDTETPGSCLLPGALMVWRESRLGRFVCGGHFR